MVHPELDEAQGTVDAAEAARLADVADEFVERCAGLDLVGEPGGASRSRDGHDDLVLADGDVAILESAAQAVTLGVNMSQLATLRLASRTQSAMLEPAVRRVRRSTDETDREASLALLDDVRATLRELAARLIDRDVRHELGRPQATTTSGPVI